LLAPYFLYAALLHLMRGGELGPRFKVLALAVYLSIGGLPAAANRVINLMVVCFDNRAGHEYVNDTPLAECLRKIPVAGTLLVTNDLRYPANNFWRSMMQMQIPGIFGHRMYAGNLRWEKYFVDENRFGFQDSLIAGDLETIERHAETLGWTHGVLFKRKPFVRGDWPVLCENDEVLIVEFPSQSRETRRKAAEGGADAEDR
jgi:hypothetical protein